MSTERYSDIFLRVKQRTKLNQVSIKVGSYKINNYFIMQDNSILTVSSPFRLKTLFTKPLKYVIQIFTRDETEHAAGYSYGLVLNTSGEGFRKIPFDKWMKHYAINDAEIREYYPPIPFTKEQEGKMMEFDNLCVQNYGAIDAVITVLDDIKPIREFLIKLNYKPKGILCSQQRFLALCYAGIFPYQDNTLSPAELKKKLLKAGWIKRRVN